jgi:ACS family hexuronate transporter-like MFS transporter
MIPTSMATETPTAETTQRESRLRWFIVGWITLSTMLNLIDRQTLSIVAPYIRDEFGLSNSDYANILNAFLLSYTIMYTVGGRLVDRIGEKIGMTLFVLWWSLSTMLHSLTSGALSLGAFRFLLGVGEPGNYPAALRAVTTWFAKRERGFPIALYSSGSSVGSLIAVPLVAWITLTWGWRTAFVVPGLIGLVWVVVWWKVYRNPSPRMAAALSGANSLKVVSDPSNGVALPSMLQLLKDRRVLAILAARLITDPVWTFFLFWTPQYLKSERGFSLTDIGLYAWIPFLFGGAGGMLGGAASDFLIRRGFSAARARTLVLYVTAVVAPAGAVIGFVGSAGLSIALIAMMAFVCYAWFINTAALASDVFPENVIGTVQGYMGTIGCIGGMILTWVAGTVLDRFDSYTPMFVIAASGHLTAAIVLRVFLKTREE